MMPDGLLSDLDTLSDFVLPALLAVGGLLLGLLAERVVLPRLARSAERTRTFTDNVIVRAFRGVPLIWGAALGLWLALEAYGPTGTAEVTLETLLAVIVLWSVVLVSARIVAGLLQTYSEQPESALPPTTILPNLARLTVYAIGILIVLNSLGIPVTPVLTALGVGGLAVALALQDTLSNVFAGLYLIAAKQYQPGHFVELDSGEAGYVHDITWRATLLRTVGGNLVVVPNAKLAGATATNYYLPTKRLRARFALPFSYDVPPDQMKALLLEEARAVLRDAYGTEVPPDEPEIFLHTFGEFSLNYVVFLPVTEYFDQYRLRDRFLRAVRARLEREGLPFPFPMREVELGIAPGETPPSDPEARLASPPIDENPGDVSPA